MPMKLGFDPVFVIGGFAIVVYGLIGKKPFYNEVEMPLTREEREDKRPPTKAERAGYVGFGVLLVLFGLWRLSSDG